MGTRSCRSGATFFLVIIGGLAGCSVPPIQGRQYLTGDPFEDQEKRVTYHPLTGMSEQRVWQSDEEGLAICNQILAKDPNNKYARANKALYERKLEEAKKSEDNNRRVEEFEASLSVAERVRWKDWWRHYWLLRGRPFNYSDEEAKFKATRLYGGWEQYGVSPGE